MAFGIHRSYNASIPFFSGDDIGHVSSWWEPLTEHLLDKKSWETRNVATASITVSLSFTKCSRTWHRRWPYTSPDLAFIWVVAGRCTRPPPSSRYSSSRYWEFLRWSAFWCCCYRSCTDCTYTKTISLPSPRWPGLSAICFTFFCRRACASPNTIV